MTNLLNFWNLLQCKRCYSCDINSPQSLKLQGADNEGIRECLPELWIIYRCSSGFKNRMNLVLSVCNATCSANLAIQDSISSTC